jgi:hypothetical protein
MWRDELCSNGRRSSPTVALEALLQDISVDGFDADRNLL